MLLFANVRRTSITGGYLWLAVAFQLLLVATLFAVVSPAALVYAVLGIAALILAAILLTQLPTLLVFIVSIAGGLLSSFAGLLVASRPSLLPVALAVAYTAISAVLTVVSAIGARQSARRG